MYPIVRLKDLVIISSFKFIIKKLFGWFNSCIEAYSCRCGS